MDDRPGFRIHERSATTHPDGSVLPLPFSIHCKEITKMFTNRSALVAGTLCAAVASAASAATTVPPTQDLQFNYSGIASGTLDGVSFSGKAFTFTGYGNTQSRAVFNNALFVGYSIAHSSTDFTIDGFNAGSVTSQMATVSSALFGQNKVSLSLGPANSVTKFIFSISEPAWDMTGPFSGGAGSTTYNTASSGIPAIQTSLGELRFTSIGSPAAFTAAAVPAPGAVALVGLAGLAGSRRRRA
jgi:MYXO-CTERM domain-containing protein